MSRVLVAILILLLLLFLVPLPPTEAGKLADDGRAGAVLDVQGTALVRPAGRSRWTPLGPKSVLYPGDLIKTAARGAHALEFQAGPGSVLVGPAALLELASDGAVRLLRGELEAHGDAKAPLAVRGPGDFALDVKDTAWLRAAERTTTRLDKTPRWIEGYRASASDEWMGSLLATVDGRDVPMAVGYHKVDVEVRDQIARTTVEQSFVNATDTRLEGVFYFPLPADASISGFGMWIGGELVEADIVERQRARQIYEDILRRKKDPGLLEWEGGNVFKARVFPIEARSEKRIRIRYTQVLPLTGSTWRYRYALRSELLQSRPLRQLQLTLRAVSARPLLEVGSPTHECVVHRSPHEATVEFSASEYRPTNDFEVAVKIDRGSDLVAIPHRRGDDGYFMLMLAPPDAEAGAWTRDLVPEGKPLDLVLVADTSGSMDDGARANQAAFLEALLGLLGERDRFRLLACDAEAHWIVEQATPAGEEAAAAALETLAARRSLGWTDLDLALKEALAKTSGGGLVVYVGDGVGTTGDADPIALAERLRVLGRTCQATVHAVAPSSSYETPVLEALSEIGGGSLRAVGSKPAATAFDLMAEAARPVVRGLEVRVEGLRTARVYPERLPNLPSGAQQVVLGRFLPTDGAQAQRGTVVVTGRLDGKEVRYSAPLEIPAADAGNSFLPRLWGRRHIDALLAEGRSKEVQEEIVAFSERFGIMTPYTSFLVLESDEDRERYGVERRVRMRDGERFFAQARDRAALELKRQQMKAAGRWRTDMRHRMLLEIARLGRDLPILLPPSPESFEAAFGLDGGGDEQPVFRGPSGGLRDRGLSLDADDVYEGKGEARGWGARFAGKKLRSELAAGEEEMDEEVPPGIREPAESAAAPPAAAPAPPAARRARKAAEEAGADGGDDGPVQAGESLEEMQDALEGLDKSPESYGGAGRRRLRPQGGLAPGYLGREESLKRLGYEGPRWHPVEFTLQSLGFPALPEPPEEDVGGEGEPWDEEVLALLLGLPRRASTGMPGGGLHVVVHHANLHATRATVLGASQTEAWLGAQAWRVRTDMREAGEPYDEWCADGVRGALTLARHLARTRKAKPTDGDAWWLPLWDLQARDVIADWRRQGYVAAITKRAGDLVTVTLRRREPDRRAMVLQVDGARRVIVEQRWIDQTGRPAGRIARSDFVVAAGRFWAQRIERFDRRDRLTGRTTVSVEALPAEGLARALAESRAGLAQAITVDGPLPEDAEAKQARHERKATFVHHLVIALRHGQRQQWGDALASWEAAQALVPDKPGRHWIHGEFLGRSRRGEDLRQDTEQMVARVEARSGALARFLTALLWQRADGILGPTERGRLLDRLKPLWIQEGAPGVEARTESWLHARADAAAQAGDGTRARELHQEAAQRFPFSLRSQLAYEQDLWSTARSGEAVSWAERLLAEREPWLEAERDALYQRLSDRLWQRRRLEDLHATLTRWISTNPEVEAAWSRWLSSFYFLGRTDAGDAAVLEGLRMRLDYGQGDQAFLEARQAASVSLALGSGWNFNLSGLHEPWVEPLADLCVNLWHLDSARDTPVARIWRDWRFGRTDARKRMLASLRAEIVADGAVETLGVPVLARYVHWLAWGRNQVDEAVWRAVTDRLNRRFAAEEDADRRRQLGDLVLQMLDAHGEREEAIAFVRARLERAGPRARPAIAEDLFRRLIATPVRDEYATTAREDELLALLSKLVHPDDTAELARARTAQRVRQLVDRLYAWRYEAGLGTPEERAPLTRAALKALREDVRAKTRRGLVARLAEAEAAVFAVARPWLQLERLGYAVELGEDLAGVVAEARAVLGADWVREDVPLDRLLRERTAVVLTYAATRRNASPDLQAGALGAFQHGLEIQDAAAAKDPQREDVELLDWRYQVFRLLVALDQPESLEPVLKAWIVPANVESRWRIALGYLLAETGRVAEAAAQFEAVHALGELAAADYAVLADWYLVLDDDARREKALDARYDHMNEYGLSQLVWQHEAKIRQGPGGVPVDFDPETLRILRTLMRKTRAPANYWYRIRDIYRKTKDHRVLECVGDALVGHTQEGIYGFLARLRSLAAEIHEEATCDGLGRRLHELAAQVERPLDRRALQLAISQVEARASLVPQADPAHGARALAALEDAFRESWQEGEARLMASYLYGLGKIEDPATAAEQRRQLEALLDREPPESMAHLHIAVSLAETHWKYARHDDVLAVMESALRDVRTGHGGRVPQDGHGALTKYTNWLMGRGRFGAAERTLLGEIERWDLPGPRRQLRLWLYATYASAVRNGGSVSLGRGTPLFEAAAALMENDMAEAPADARPVLNTYCSLHEWAAERGTPRDAGARLEAYGRDRFTVLLERLPINGTGYVRTLARMVRRLNGPQSGLGFLLDRHDAEPRWLARIGQDIWGVCIYEFARWRAEAGRIGDLEPRLLALVLAQLEDDLRTGSSNGYQFWNHGNKWFWRERADDFADAAGRVAELHESSPAVFQRAANLLWHSLGRHQRAIGILQSALARDTLDEGGRWTLSSWLVTDKRFAEALPIAKALATERPDRLDYRLQRAEVLAELGRKDDALEVMEATEAHFREKKLWREHTAARLGTLAAKLRLADPAARWMEEAIRLRIDSTGYRGGRDSTLSRYYRELARARGWQRRTEAAVRAASTAILSANPRNARERQEADASLQEALESAEELEAYVETYEAEVKRSGLDAPVIRKTLARVFAKRGQDRAALHHLLEARALDAHDADVHKALVETYDRLGDAEGAIEALFGSIRLAPHNLDAYLDLAARYGRAGRGAQAERALTSLVETSPHQAAGHRRLAQEREKQKRLPEATVQWRQVVHLERLDPTGWLSLARALIASDRKAEAREAIEHVLANEWESRFGDVKAEAANLLRQL